MISMLLATSLALAADVDRAPSGAIVTIRPSSAEHVEVRTAAGVRVTLPVDMPPMWLVNPEAWRLAVGCGAERDVLRTSLAQATSAVAACQTDLDATSATYDLCTGRYNACTGQCDALDVRARAAEEDVVRLRKRQVPLILVSTGVGLVVGAGAVVGLAFSL